MPSRNVIGAVMAAAVLVAATGAFAFDDAKYPDLKGLWTRARVPGAVGQPPHDPSRRPAAAREPRSRPNTRQGSKPTW